MCLERNNHSLFSNIYKSHNWSGKFFKTNLLLIIKGQFHKQDKLQNEIWSKLQVFLRITKN